MPYLNKAQLLGHLGRNPDLRQTESGRAVCNFSLATSDGYKDKATGEWVNNTNWHYIVCWGDLGERAAERLEKGDLAYIEGKITTRTYQNKEGEEKQITEIIARELKTFKKSEGPPPFQPKPQAQPEFDDDIPF